MRRPTVDPAFTFAIALVMSLVLWWGTLKALLDGEVDITVADERRHLTTGDVCVMNRGVEHELYSEGGVTFFEALAPVPLDHVPDKERDLVLGPDGGSQHVES